MSIKQCSECEQDISTKADACPHCGAKQASVRGCGAGMAKGGCGLVVLVIIILIVIVAAAGA